MIPTRRTFLAGLGAVLAAPAVIRTPKLLMPVRSFVPLSITLHVKMGADSVIADGSADRPFATIQAAARWAEALSRRGRVSRVAVGTGTYQVDRPIRLSELFVTDAFVLLSPDTEIDRLHLARSIVDARGAGTRAIGGEIVAAEGSCFL